MECRAIYRKLWAKGKYTFHEVRCTKIKRHISGGGGGGRGERGEKVENGMRDVTFVCGVERLKNKNRLVGMAKLV
jgi:hypothetical protein